jgi:serine protease Do
LTSIAEHLRRITVQIRGRERGVGSGVIWRPDGVIITNAHVARAPRATVALADGRMLEATVTVRDPGLDLALLTVAATDLPAAVVDDSNILRVGELVFAVGNPFGVSGALTAGIVHAVGPTESADGRRWVQADIRLAPGNSGGPLANAQGRVIGVNSMIAGGLALAVPSHVVERFRRRRHERPYVGVTTRPVFVRPGGRRLLGLLVLDVASGSPAEAAGILLGDVLIGVAGHVFSAPDDLAKALDGASAGDPLGLDLIRGGMHLSREVVVRAGAFAVEAA